MAMNLFMIYDLLNLVDTIPGRNSPIYASSFENTKSDNEKPRPTQSSSPQNSQQMLLFVDNIEDKWCKKTLTRKITTLTDRGATNLVVE
jgi:hypothetical protein